MDRTFGLKVCNHRSEAMDDSTCGTVVRTVPNLDTSSE